MRLCKNAFYTSIFKQKIHSIYIRGSVARARAILGFSDYDCFAILLNESTELEKSSIRKATFQIQNDFDFVSNFDLTFFVLSDFLTNEDYKHWRFAAKVQSLCIYGDDLIPTLPSFRPDSEIIFSLAHLEDRIKKAKDRLYNYFDPTLVKYWCSWIMRTFARCGFELVIDREKKYTNELSLCCKVFSKYYPQKKMEMYKALELSINPITNLEEIFTLIETLGDWLVEERKAIYKR